MRIALLGVVVAAALSLAPTAHAAAPSRILYLGDWTGQPEVFAVDPSGKAPVAQLTHWDGGCRGLPRPYDFTPDELIPSPNGGFLLVRCGTALWLMRANGDATRLVVAARGAYPDKGGVVGRIVWSGNSKQFIYAFEDGPPHLVDAAGGRDRVATTADIDRVGWNPSSLLSPDRHFAVNHVSTAYSDEFTLTRTRGGVTVARFPGALAAQWSPDGKKLAIEDRSGIRLFSILTKRIRPLVGDVGFGGPPGMHEHEAAFGLAWAPEGRRLAYITGKQSFSGGGWSIRSGSLMTATLRGATSTTVARDRAYGGRITAVAWTRVPKGTTYRRADEEPTSRVAPTGVLANGRVELLAADGPRVAFIACNRVAVWTPRTGILDDRGAGDPPGACAYDDLTGRYVYYDLAVAGNRVAYALSIGCNSITISLSLQELTSAPSENVFEEGGGYCGGPFVHALGRLAGSGNLLVYGTWHESYPAPPPDYRYAVLEGTVRRVGEAGCTCPVIARTFGPLYPADVDGGHVVAYGTNETLVFDADGNSLMTLPVSPLAAQLAGNDLVILRRGHLLDYDIRGAAPLHDWPLPDVPSGPVCAWRTCESVRLTLTDAARGLVAYIVDGQLHLLRLADGSDKAIGRASLARFMDAGLVYADGTRLRLVGFEKLPLRGF